MSHRDQATDARSIESCYAAGIAAFEAGEVEDVREWAARCDELGGQGDARGIALQGLVCVGAEDFEGAVAQFRRMLGLATDPALVRPAVEALAESGAITEAIEVLEEAIRRAPAQPAPLLDLAHLRLIHGDAEGAREAADGALALSPDEAPIARAAARIFEAAGEPGLAARSLSRLSGEAPSAGLLLDAARLYLASGRYPEAEKTFRSLGGLDADYQLVAQHGRAWCRIRVGDWRGALESALDATRMDRLGLTTAFLAYARDRLFGAPPDAAARESELGERFAAELQQHLELHSGAAAVPVQKAEGEHRA